MDFPNDISELQSLVLQLLSKVDGMGNRIAELEQESAGLRAEVASLRGQLTQKSGNSSKPPSSDGYKRKIKNNCAKSGKKIGGQKGHEGTSLEFSATPDTVVDIPSPSHCPCGQSISETPLKRTDRRQVYDTPPMWIKKSGHITDSDRALVEKNCDFIVETANLSTPRVEKSAKSRGRPKQSAERNLLDAFIERKDDILRFVQCPCPIRQ